MDVLYKELFKEYGFESMTFIGPVEASPYKVNDIYRKILYIKNESYDILLKVRKSAQILEDSLECFKNMNVQYDL
jgi:primosomal protein N' (replication factor Y)